MNLKIKKRVFNDVYFPFLWDNTRYLHFYGGSGSGKSVFVAQKVILESFKTTHDFLVIRKVERTIKESVYKLIKQIITQWKLQDYFDFTTSPASITNKVTGSRFVFSGLDDPEKIKSIVDIQKIWIEEATELTRDDLNELDRRLRGLKNHQIIFSYNPIDESHWLKIDFHNEENEKIKILKTTYLDNKFLDVEYKETFDRLKKVDENQWRVYALGEWGVQSLAHKFDIKKVLAIQTKPPIDIIDNVKRYRDPDNKIYSLAIDPSSGLGKDYTSITMREMSEGYPLVAQMKAKVDEIQTAQIASGLASIFEQNGGKVYIACEINGNGRAVQNQLLHIYRVETMSDIEAWRFYRRFDTDPTAERNKFRGNFGWQTTSANRDVMITEFAHLFQLDKVEVLNEDEKEEMRVFVWNDKKNRYEAQEGQHDDLLFSDFICIQNMKFIAKYG